MTILLFVICGFSCCSYNNTERAAAQNNGIHNFYTIDFEESFNTERQMFLSEITDSILYVILKTPPEIVITSVRKVLNTDRFLFVQAKGDVYQFFKNGQFIRRIGSKGKGPGEYYIASDFFIDAGKREIAIISYPKILYFSIDGIYKKQHLVHSTNAIVQDSLIWCTVCPSRYSPWNLVALSTNFDTVKSLANDRWIQPIGPLRVVVSKLLKPFYTHNGQVYFKGDEDNDTIWNIAGNNSEIHAVVHMGKYKLPFEYNPSVSFQKFEKSAIKLF